MKKTGFDNSAYLKNQSEHIKRRIAQFGGKLYLEFGGKLFDDYHASRVLPGFEPDSKVRMLMELRSEAEIVVAINAHDIERNKRRGDLGITYDNDALRLIDAFRDFGLYVGSVVITQYSAQPSADQFQKRLHALGIPVYRHYVIKDYPANITHIVSDEGFGRNDYLETSKSLVVVTAPGPGSGKMAVCLSQLYHEHKRGKRAGYAKFETFPIWNLPLKHPVNLAYEAATADLNDVNMIDPYHLEAYGEKTVNYNRDIEIFPILTAMMERILGTCPYNSPTDMSVNMAGNCIIDDEICMAASKQEIIRRFYHASCMSREGLCEASQVLKIELLMNQLGVSKDDRPVVKCALDKAAESNNPAVALELADGTIVTGKTSDLLGASASCLLNALKHLAHVDDSALLIAPELIDPIQKLKVRHMGNRNPRLHTDEVLIALAISAVTEPDAALCIDQLRSLAGCEAHATVILSRVDDSVFQKLGVNITCEPQYETQKLYRR